VVFGVVVLAGAMVISSLGFVVLSQHGNDRRIDHIIANGRASSCAQAQADAKRARSSFTDAAQGLIHVAGSSPSDPRVKAYLADQTARANKNNPIRDCDADGIQSFFGNAPPPEPCPQGGDGKGFCK
jgi:hypothetical protein